MQSIQVYIKPNVDPTQSLYLGQFLHILQNTFYSNRMEYSLETGRCAPPKTKYIDILINVKKDSILESERVRIINDVNHQNTEVYISNMFRDCFFANKVDIATKRLNPDQFHKVNLSVQCFPVSTEKLSKKDKKAILFLFKKGDTKTSIAKKFKVSIQTITKVYDKMRRKNFV